MFRREERRREEERRMVHRHRRRRMVVGDAVVVGSTEAMVKMSEADAQKVQQATGTPPEDMSHEELQQTMQQQNIQAQPVTQEDQRAMSSAETADPQSGAES
jgi:hypothetical protein